MMVHMTTRPAPAAPLAGFAVGVTDADGFFTPAAGATIHTTRGAALRAAIGTDAAATGARLTEIVHLGGTTYRAA